MEELILFLASPEISGLYQSLHFLFLSVTIFFIGFLLFFLFTTRWFKLAFWYDFIEFFTLKIYGGNIAQIKWSLLKNKTKNIKPEMRGVFAIKAHKILEKLLERLVPLFYANTFGEKLARCAQGTFSDPTSVWWAHEIYRSVLKENYYIINDEEFEKLIKTYDQAFKDLGL